MAEGEIVHPCPLVRAADREAAHPVRRGDGRIARGSQVDGRARDPAFHGDGWAGVASHEAMPVDPRVSLPLGFRLA